MSTLSNYSRSSVPASNPITAEDAASSFVESLFGSPSKDRQSKRRSLQNISRKSGRSFPSSRTSMRGQTSAAHDFLNAQEISEYENEGLTHAEAEQSSHLDRFWGLDKEAQDCALERMLMTQESEYSITVETEYRNFQKQKNWEKEEERKNYEAAYVSSIRENQARKAYMRAFYQADSTADVIFFKWPTTQHFHKQKSNSRRKVSLITDDSPLEEDVENMIENFLRNSDSGFEIIDSMEPLSSIHVGGMQQSMCVSNSDSEPATGTKIQGEVVRSGSASVAARAMRPLKTHHPRRSHHHRGKSSSSQRSHHRGHSASAATSGSDGEGGGFYRGSGGEGGSGFSRSMTRSTVTDTSPIRSKSSLHMGRETSPGSGHGNGRMSPGRRPGSAGGAFHYTEQKHKATKNIPSLRSRPRHIPAIDGHHSCRWDQVLLLRHVFSRLEKKTAGSADSGVTAENLASIENDSVILELLRFTVLGIWVKRKQWSKFQSLLNGRTCLSLLDLVQGARSLSLEYGVRPRFIRTDEEHQRQELSRYFAETDVAASADEHAFRDYYATLMREKPFEGNREAYLSRVLVQGDCVWGMIGGACVWLPAVIETVRDDGTYDLSYPLTLGALQQAKMLATSRELLSYAQPATQILASKPFRNEKEVCEFVFDVIGDGSSRGSTIQTIEGKKLREGLSSLRLSNVVRSSASLSLILFGSHKLGLSEPDALFNVFLSEFSSDGQISRPDFVDFCVNMQEMYCEVKRIQ